MKRQGHITAMAIILILVASFSIGLANSDNTIAFGEVAIGQTVSVAFTYPLQATREIPAQVSIGSPCSPFALAGLESQELVLNPGDSVSFYVTFSPHAAANYTCSFIIRATGGMPVQVSETVVELSGQGGGGTSQEPDDPSTPLPSIFDFPWEELLQTQDTGVGTGMTQRDGTFEVSIPPFTTITGTLLECGGLPIEQVAIQIVSLDGAKRLERFPKNLLKS